MALVAGAGALAPAAATPAPALETASEAPPAFTAAAAAAAAAAATAAAATAAAAVVHGHRGLSDPHAWARSCNQKEQKSRRWATASAFPRHLQACIP